LQPSAASFVGVAAGEETMPSTAVRDIAYDAIRKELSVTFVPTGKEYVYFNVPKDVYLAFMSAGSRGRFFNFYIRDRYEFREVAPAAR
jgi:hypothetical protein